MSVPHHHPRLSTFKLCNAHLHLRSDGLAPPLQPQKFDQQYFQLNFLNSEHLHRKGHLQLRGNGLAPPLQPAQIDKQ